MVELTLYPWLPANLLPEDNYMKKYNSQDVAIYKY